MSQRRMRLSMEAADLLLATGPEGISLLAEKFPDVDLHLEAVKCCAYWNHQGGFLVPKLAFLNWVQKAAQPLPRRKAPDGRGMTPGAADMDRMGFLEDYEHRRGPLTTNPESATLSPDRPRL